MSPLDTTRPAEARRRGVGVDNVDRALVLAAFACGLLVVLGALTLPIVTTLPSSTSSTVIAPAQPATSPDNPATWVIHSESHRTILEADGATGIAVASAPAITSLLVVGLLRPGGGARRKAMTAGAWILSTALLLASVVGFLTILVGLAGVPTGVLLVLACARSRT